MLLKSFLCNLLCSSLVLIVSIVIVINAQDLSNLDLAEHDVCRSEGEVEWTCKKVVDCPEAGDFRYSRPGICSFQGRMPIVCCPPSMHERFATSPFRISAAKEFCERAMKDSCPNYAKDLHNQNWPPGGVWNGFGGGWNGFGGNFGPYGYPQRGFRRHGFGGHGRRNFSPPDNRPSIIVGGQTALPRTRSYSALVGFGSSKAPQWNCGGSLISEIFVLSAAHCSETRSLGPAKWVLLGDLDLSTKEEDSKPEQFTIVLRIVHPEYKEPALYNDIALFKLDRPVVFSEWIKPVCLHTSMEIPSQFATATGWGRTDFAGDTSPQLREVDLTLISGEECSKVLNASRTKMPQGVTSARILCAGETEGGKDTCSGDSGGPLVIEEKEKCLYTQVGITSFGKECALANSPGIYTRVSSFIPWIESIVWPHP